MGFATFLIGCVRSVVSDQWVSHGYDLPAVRRIGQNFLITRHRRVETNLADTRPAGAERYAIENPAIFKGEETKMDSKKSVPFQRNQMGKIVEVLDMPRKEDWPGIVDMPEYQQLQPLLVYFRHTRDVATWPTICPR